MQDTPDLSKIIGLIMQNPELISEIAALAKPTEAKESSVTDEGEESEAAAVESAVISDAPPEGYNRRRRKELLSAMKPYLSESRRSAIDSMSSILDILDVMVKK